MENEGSGQNRMVLWQASGSQVYQKANALCGWNSGTCGGRCLRHAALCDGVSAYLTGIFVQEGKKGGNEIPGYEDRPSGIFF